MGKVQRKASVSLEERISRLARLDFTMVRRKLMEPPPEGWGWSEACCRAAEKWYRRFLALHIKYPHQKLVPNAMIDIFWHQHVLDTRGYSTDCEHVFGHFLHHFPYFGMNGDADQRDEGFRETNDLFRKEFGEDPLSLGEKALECSMDCGWVEPDVSGALGPDDQEEEIDRSSLDLRVLEVAC